MPDAGQAAGRDWQGHLLLLYGSQAQRVSALVTWIRRGLEDNEKVIYAEPRQATAGLRPGSALLLGPGECAARVTSARSRRHRAGRVTGPP